MKISENKKQPSVGSCALGIIWLVLGNSSLLGTAKTGVCLLTAHNPRWHRGERKGATGSVFQRGLLCYEKAWIPEEDLCLPCCSAGACLALGSSGGGRNRLVESTCRERTSGATYEHIPKDKNAGGTQSNSDLVTLLRVSNYTPESH